MNLALVNETGLGVAKDMAQAVRWYRVAATNGVAEAQVKLGAMLATGTLGETNLPEALLWFRRAAENGDRIMIMPGVYREEPSRRIPVKDPKCAGDEYWEDSGDSHQEDGRVPTFLHQQDCPNSTK